MSWFGGNSKKAEIFRVALGADDEGVVIFDGAGKIIFANDVTAKMSGYNNAGAMLGGNILEAIVFQARNNKSIDLVANQIVATVKARQKWESRDYEIVSAKGGTTLAVKITLIPFANDNEQLFLMKLRDLTEDLERDQAQAEFISTASHEMRTPVAAIQGYIGLALNPKLSNIDAKARMCLESAQAASNRLGELFRNLLDVSRLEDGKLQPQLARIEVKGFVQKLKNDFEILARNKKQHFSFALDPQEAYCNLDFTFLQDIVMNFVENAVKYTPEGGDVKLWSKVNPNTVEISVSDNGPGIDENDLQHIFQKFYRSGNTNLQVGGTGLGLYLAKQRAEMMGGQIKVASAPGRGSVFTVVFPRVAGEDYDLNNNSASTPNEIVVEQITPLSKEERLAADPLGEDMTKFIKYPKLPQELGSKPFIKIAERWRNGEIPSTSEEDKQWLYKETRSVNQNIPQEQFDAVWNKFLPRLENPGLAGMMKTFANSPTGFNSTFIIPWMLISPSAPSWEFGFAMGYDFAGRWREFPKDERAYKTALRDPVFCWVRERAILARKEIAGKDKVLFLKAGCLPELRNISYYPMPKEVWACDDDVSLNTKDIFGWSTADHNVHYEIAGLFDYMEKIRLEGLKFDVIVMNGATIGYYDNLDHILEEAIKLLKPGGKIVFDVQLMHWDIVRARFVFGVIPDVVSNLSGMDETLYNVNKICSRLPNVRLKYAVDSGDKPPTGIMFYLET